MPPGCHVCEEKKLIYHVTVLIWAESAAANESLLSPVFVKRVGKSCLIWFYIV